MRGRADCLLACVLGIVRAPAHYGDCLDLARRQRQHLVLVFQQQQRPLAHLQRGFLVRPREDIVRAQTTVRDGTRVVELKKTNKSKPSCLSKQTQKSQSNLLRVSDCQTVRIDPYLGLDWVYFLLFTGDA